MEEGKDWFRRFSCVSSWSVIRKDVITPPINEAFELVAKINERAMNASDAKSSRRERVAALTTSPGFPHAEYAVKCKMPGRVSFSCANRSSSSRHLLHRAICSYS